MKNKIILPFISKLEASLKAHPGLIQVVLGPRQVGKTTGILQFIESLPGETVHYQSADGLVSLPGRWLEEQWHILKSRSPRGLLVIDEIQKVEHWSEVLKKLWDEQLRLPEQIRVVLLGSSSLDIQRGLNESLAGRFLLYPVFQWNLDESRRGFGMSFEDFLVYGGYPGSYPFLNNRIQWLNYMRSSIVDTVIGKDILQLARVKSPALFRQSFYLACSYGAREISYTKLLGQLQDRGNVELVKHYLELFEGAFLIKQLFKFSNKRTLSRSSSPKILPFCPALFALTLDGDFNADDRGWAFEIAVGCELMRWPGELYYWRERNDEVDFVHKFGKKITAIEVKSGRKKSPYGVAKFKEKFPTAAVAVITPENFEATLFQLAQQTLG